MRAPEIRVMDQVFGLLAVIDHYESLQWTRKLYEVGDVELRIAADDTGADTLQPGRVVFTDKDHAALLQYVEKSESKKGVQLVARGVQLKGLAQRRVTVPGQKQDETFYGYDRYPALESEDAPAESVFKHYAQAHLTAPEDGNRKFPLLVIAQDQGRGVLMRWQSRFEPLDTVFKEIGAYSGMGYDITLDLKRGRYVFEVIQGSDHTAGSAKPVLFSTGFDNLESSTYTVDEKPWRNAAYAGGAGEDEQRLIQTIFENERVPAGFDRRETWIDGGSIDNVEDLIYEARYKVREKTRTETLTGDLAPSGPFVYRKDWDLGDLVTLQNKRLGVALDTRITEVKESYERDRQEVIPVFGKRNKNLLDEIRRTEVVR